ncbi:MAG: hypothetical protein U0Y08_05660 [Bacteroidia bacterium]
MKTLLSSHANQFANLLISQFANCSIRKFPALIVFILTTISMVSTNSFCQEIEWQNTIGGDSFDQLRAIQVTNDGGYILGGFSQSDISGDKTDSSVSSDF